MPGEDNWLDSARAALGMVESVCGGNLNGKSILDIGCGTKISKILIEQETPIARYVGIDANTSVIEFLRDEVADTRFDYHWLDAHNGKYNPSGIPMSEMEGLPIEGEVFDAISLFSVFTHLIPEDFVSMLRLARPHVRADGRLLGTVFLNESGGTGWGIVDQQVRKTMGPLWPSRTARMRRLRVIDELSSVEFSMLSRIAANHRPFVIEGQRILAIALRDPYQRNEVLRLLSHTGHPMAGIAAAATSNMLHGGNEELAKSIREELVAGNYPELSELIEQAHARVAGRYEPDANAPLPPAPGRPADRFVDYLLDDPLGVAVYTRDYMHELIRGTGWAVETVHPPQQYTQHCMILRPE